MKIECIIVDDEPLAIEKARGFVAKLPYLKLMGTFESAIDALAFLSSNSVDLIFLDVHMDEMSGIQLLESKAIKGQVILTTAYDQYALKGYDLSVSDYLLKPYSFERFVQAVDKVKSLLPQSTSPVDQSFLFVKTENRLEKIDLHQVLFIEGMRDYRRIHLPDRRIMTLQTFSELQRLISARMMLRVHKSYMVSITKIESIERNRIKIGQEMIPISDSYKTEFFSRIKS